MLFRSDELPEGNDGPCIEEYDPPNTDNPNELYVDILTPPGDPHFGG